jgi:hypothetical protein
MAANGATIAIRLAHAIMHRTWTSGDTGLQTIAARPESIRNRRIDNTPKRQPRQQDGSAHTHPWTELRVQQQP